MYGLNKRVYSVVTRQAKNGPNWVKKYVCWGMYNVGIGHRGSAKRALPTIATVHTLKYVYGVTKGSKVKFDLKTNWPRAITSVENWLLLLMSCVDNLLQCCSIFTI